MIAEKETASGTTLAERKNKLQIKSYTKPAPLSSLKLIIGEKIVNTDRQNQIQERRAQMPR